MKHKTYKFSILALALVLVMALTAFLTVTFLPAKAEGSVTVNGTNVFTSTGDANVIAHKEGDGDGAEYYTMFSFASDDDGVSYRRNLAYNWIQSDKSDEDGKTPLSGMFNMEIGFESLSFERFVVTFESQQYNKTKDSKSVNYVMFFPADGGKVYALVTDDKDAQVGDIKEDNKAALDADHITIKFTEKLAGAYKVEVGNAEGTPVTGTLENVSGNYAKSSTSSTSPVYPLIFNAEFAKEGERKATNMTLYSLNGQSFKLSNTSYSESGNYYYNGTVTDNTCPVICLNEEINYFKLGGEIDINYTVVDVLRTSPSSTVYYYVLDYESYNKVKNGETIDFDNKELFAELDDDTLLESDVDKYLPVEADLQGTKFDAYTDANGTLVADMLVKIYIKVTDTTSSNGEPDEVYFDWYVADGYKVNVNNSAFIAVANDELGITYNYDNDNKDGWSDADDGVIAQYQAKVNEAAKNLSAGSSSYLYLPSAEILFADDATAYTDMKFNIYFYHDSQQSNTGNTSNNLSINVTKQGAYTFTIYATDASGNNMYYLEEVKEDEGYDKKVGDKFYKIVKFASSEVWTMFDDKDGDGLYYKLPWFTFDVSYTGVQFEETPGMQSTAYVGTSYNSASFKINGITGSYETKYRLFRFDRARYFNDKGITFTYEEFIKQMDELFENAETRTYFTEILEVNEADEEYEEFKDYAWNSSSTSFVPQDANALYLIRAELTDNQYNTDPVTCNLAVVASIKAKTIKGESDWLKNNVASVVLLAVAGVALIGIVLLLVIKPKDKGDIDVQYENAKNKQKNKKK